MAIVKRDIFVKPRGSIKVANRTVNNMVNCRYRKRFERGTFVSGPSSFASYIYSTPTFYISICIQTLPT